jgi:hypothetical protein
VTLPVTALAAVLGPVFGPGHVLVFA